MRHNSRLTRQELNENTTVLDSEQDPRRLMFLEAIYITINQPTINRQCESMQMLPSKKRRYSVENEAANQGTAQAANR